MNRRKYSWEKHDISGICTADVVCKSFPAAPGLKESAVGSESVSSVCELLSGSVSETAGQ